MDHDSLTGLRDIEADEFSVEDMAYVADPVPQGVPEAPCTPDPPRYFAAGALAGTGEVSEMGRVSEVSVVNGMGGVNRMGGVSGVGR